MKKIFILAYHKIGDPPDGWHTWNYIPTSVFEQQIQYLIDNKFNVIDTEMFVRALDGIEPLPDKPILITFDDGYENNLKEALPVLQKFACPAVIFLATAYVDGYNAFDADIMYEPKDTICTWDQLRQLQMSGVSIEAHSHTHPHFSQLTLSEINDELIESKRLIESNLNKQVQLFSFPYGDNGGNDEEIKKLLSSIGYKAAMMYGGGPAVLAEQDIFRISRIPVGAETDFNDLLR
jgi:peptidoglycan/xylan/chitin deacetylase (PgdA/CDA1 family)